MVKSGEAALVELEKSASDSPYQLVLMDWLMEGIMDGHQATKAIYESQEK